jgi:hypothetical protein
VVIIKLKDAGSGVGRTMDCFLSTTGRKSGERTEERAQSRRGTRSDRYILLLAPQRRACCTVDRYNTLSHHLWTEWHGTSSLSHAIPRGPCTKTRTPVLQRGGGNPTVGGVRGVTGIGDTRRILE